jgi:aspartate ammonia-lyase
MRSFDSDTLSKIVQFDQLSEAMRKVLAPRFEVRDYEAEEYIFRQGQDREALYIILQGEVDLITVAAGEEKSYLVCGPGRVLGEPAVIEEDNATHGLSGKAIASCCLARLTRETITAIKTEQVELYAELVLGVSRLMARRMMNASRSDRGEAAIAQLGTMTRREHDLLGDKDVPANVLWGIQTLRALENFSISGVRLDHFPKMIEALAHIKLACATTNHRLGILETKAKEVIVEACDELLRGLWHGHFVVDMFQGGAGTSTNMNANEVIANRALEILGEKRGDYSVLHPNSHVNMSQSTNDVYPSAIKIAALLMVGTLLKETEALAGSFAVKAREFDGVVKMGRTQLQDAVPMTLGQEFGTWSRTVAEAGKRIEIALDKVAELNIGGTAIGTGINTDPRYAPMVLDELRLQTELDLRLAPDLVEATQDTSSFVELAGVFKMLAVRLSKVCNDLRLLSSGPRCGLNEINLPPMQPGSSIMPGKVNPVIPEVVNQVAYQVIALDTAVALASEGGQLQLNVFEPVIAYNLFTSIQMLSNAMKTLRLRCVDGITANEEVCRDMVQNSIGLVTALNPYLGYERTSEVAKEALESGRTVYDIVLEKGYLSQEKLDRVLSPSAMTRPKRISLSLQAIKPEY